LESGKTKMTSLDEIGIAVISQAIVGIGITTTARVTRGFFGAVTPRIICM
jgi:hypothetical protein